MKRALLLWALASLAGCAGTNAAHAPPPVSLGKPGPWVQTELFIGLSKPGGGHVNRFEWWGFEGELGRDLPDGYTLINTNGGWRDPNGRLVREDARVILICYPKDKAAAMEPMLEKVCTEAIRRLGQQEVLRVDSDVQASTIQRQ